MKSFCKIIILILQIGALMTCSSGCESGASANEAGLKQNQNEQLKPTIYFIKMINLSKRCEEKRTIYDASEKSIIRVCTAQYKLCVIEGTCALAAHTTSDVDFLDSVSDSTEKVELINYYKTKNGKYLFTKVDQNRCPYGYGAKGICLDPFYTVAADLTIHKLGDVLFVPLVKGLKLPNGEVHDGYFIVRDKGGAIKGKNRFDFFTSFYSDRNQENPFKEIGLGNSKKRVEFSWASVKTAESVRNARRFPLTPYSN